MNAAERLRFFVVKNYQYVPKIVFFKKNADKFDFLAEKLVYVKKYL